MEKYGNNGNFGVDRRQMQAVDRKQEIYLEWPNAYIHACFYKIEKLYIVIAI